MTNAAEAGFVLDVERSAETAAGIAALCSRCFPWGMRWVRWSGCGRAWWKCAMTAHDTECIVARDQQSGAIRGFCLLVFDEPGLKQALAAARASKWDRALRAPYMPIARYFKHRMRRQASRIREVIKQGSPPSVKPRSWVEIVGVDPTCRGRGLGQILLREAQTRSETKGVRSIDALTGSWNGPAMRAFSNAGYTLFAGDGDQVLCARRLEDATR